MRPDSLTGLLEFGKVLLYWGVRDIGVAVGRVLVSQLVLLVLVYGLATRLIDLIVQALSVDARLRAASLALLVLIAVLVASRIRVILFPDSLSSLRRQPLGGLAFAMLVLPWSALLAWPMISVIALGRPAVLAVVLAVLIGAVGLLGIASARTRLVQIVRALGIGLLLISLEH